ncbi:hypothetical protein [Mucilaginibacter gilvus]|uniref:DUF4279 domain-containing protein n=1 Tax=Mucilaginibacter gilvus TaxID=2305909 RepID=A0A3S3UQX4_9SPHI|nr:hypothetical protein [Mucilaginibacter gilvus]RWY48597.1 hypothetical protein EPL05_19330 [Mucilaginibacter gilvus]
MSCILRLNGKIFDVDAFVENSGLLPYSIFYKGEDVYKSKPDGRKFESSGCMLQVSKADFDAFNQQVTDAIEYLNTNKEALRHIQTDNGPDYVYLDFGVTFNPTNGLEQNQHIPMELIKAAAERGISINLCMYTPGSDED